MQYPAESSQKQAITEKFQDFQQWLYKGLEFLADLSGTTSSLTSDANTIGSWRGLRSRAAQIESRGAMHVVFYFKLIPKLTNI